MTPASWLQSFASSLSRRDIPAAVEHFGPECFWRDFVAFTWSIDTAESRDAIRQRLEATLPGTRPHDSKPLPWWTADPATETWFSFATAAGRGVGHIRLREGRCWTLLTALRELHEPAFNSKNGTQPQVVIVGGGQGGIALGARLKRLGVPAIILEKNARAGDSWRKRYQSLVLHDPVWYDHLPYKPFPEGWPVFMPKDHIADWLEAYVEEMQLDYWAGSECLSAAYDEASGSWEIKVLKDGKPVTLSPKHLVLATGMSGFAFRPPDKGEASFKRAGGSVLHSSEYKSGTPWRGKKAVVVGASTSAHDICQDLYTHGADVTMVQRSSVIVATSDSLKEFAWGRLYSPEAMAKGIGTDLADLTVASVPLKVLPSLQRGVYESIGQKDKPLLDGLTRVGFLHDFGVDGSGIHVLYLRRGSGYYIEVGASQMIIDGKIKHVVGEVESLGEKSVRIRRPREGGGPSFDLPADLVVYATGYGNMNQWAAKLISPEVAEKIGPVWGLGSDTRYDPGPWQGELRAMWKPTKQKGLWFHGGNLMQSRHYSLYLGLQLKARMAGLVP